MDNLLPCPRCGGQAVVTFSRAASLGLPGYISECALHCPVSYHRFSRSAAIESWNNYARPVTPNVEVTGAARLYRAASVWTAGLCVVCAPTY